MVNKYKRKRHPQAIQNEGNNLLEIIWTVIPLGIVIVMFYFGWMGWKPMKNPPDDAMHVKAIARMWKFQFQYENGKVTDSLYVPINEPVILDLVSMDVLHALYIPAFRLKEDMVPGRQKFMWFIPGIEGSYDLFCAEYCGLDHSYMNSIVKVMPKDDFESLIADTSAVVPVVSTETSLADQGFEVLSRNGCIACHSSDGSKLVGPSYKDLWGTMQKVVTGREKRSVLVDKEYIERSIFEPDADLVEGFNKGLMQSYEGTVSDEDVDLIIAYLKTLND